jgi:hypothetical protein
MKAKISYLGLAIKPSSSSLSFGFLPSGVSRTSCFSSNEWITLTFAGLYSDIKDVLCPE